MKRRHAAALALSPFLLAVALGIGFLASCHGTLRKEYAYRSFGISGSGIACKAYVEKPLEGEVDLSSLPSCFESNERFHDLRYKRSVTLIVCRDDAASGRLFPLFRTKASGFAFADRLIILNYRNALKLGYSIDSAVRHESAHILFRQNMKSPTAMLVSFPSRSRWFTEGLALAAQGFILYDDAEAKAELKGRVASYDGRTDDVRISPRNLRHEYAFYQRFIEYLFQRYGRQAVMEYLGLSLVRFGSPEANYRKAFGGGIRDDLLRFCRESLDIEFEGDE